MDSVIELDWFADLEDRAQRLGQSVLVCWEGEKVLGHKEMEVDQEEFPLIRAIIWAKLGLSLPLTVEVRLDGWMVKETKILCRGGEIRGGGNTDGKGKAVLIDHSPSKIWEVGQTSRAQAVMTGQQFSALVNRSDSTKKTMVGPGSDSKGTV
ncbi:hypothetical protein QJS10_CPA10g01616 [Acorus calamus]|uniref:Uncharacterized protein n=1 Tax=Acorus calamus TaxID=4465 RepID=A0AAV9DX68_ACOCL|nr:hypothetical protein QJS10_CPA10g01616 [Acorus calamus]